MKPLKATMHPKFGGYVCAAIGAVAALLGGMMCGAWLANAQPAEITMATLAEWGQWCDDCQDREEAL